MVLGVFWLGCAGSRAFVADAILLLSAHFAVARGAGVYMLHLHTRSWTRGVYFSQNAEKYVALAGRMSINNINDRRASRHSVKSADGE
jgi:hypothetical protein